MSADQFPPPVACASGSATDESTPVTMVIEEADRTHPGTLRSPALLERARALVADRQRRADHFPGAALNFREPAWDLLLDIYIADEEGRAPILETLCRAANVDPPTAIRWITTLEDIALVEALPGGHSAPPTLRLAERGRAAMQAYLMAD